MRRRSALSPPPRRRLRSARRLRRRASRRPRRSSPASPRSLAAAAAATCVSSPPASAFPPRPFRRRSRARQPSRHSRVRRRCFALRARADGDAEAADDDHGDAGDGDDDDSGDAHAGVADGSGGGDGADGAGDGGADSDGADNGDGFADADDEAGRVASRPGYPAEPAARSRPFGRVSLAPPLPAVAARSACPAARCAPRRCRTGTLVAMADRTVRRTAAVSSRRRYAPRSSGSSPRSPSPAAPAAELASASSRALHRASPVPAAPRTGSGTAPCMTHRAGVSARARAPAERFAHFAPHRAGLRCPHPCGHCRLRLRQRAAHDCLRLQAHRPTRSIAAAAPSRRVDPGPFAVLPSPSACPLSRPAAFSAHTRRIVDAEVALAARVRCWLSMPRAIVRLSTPGVPEKVAPDW